MGEGGNGTHRVAFDGVLDTSSVPAASAFTVDGTDQAPAGVAFKSGDATMVELTLAEALLAIAGTVTVGYAAPDANPLRDPDNAKLPVPDFSGETVTNAAPADSTAPRFVSATANATTLTMIFSEALDESVPQGGSLAPFIIRGSSSFNVRPLSYAIDGDTVTLTSHENNAVRHGHGQSVTVQYLRPGPAANQFKDLSGNVLASFPAQSVTNNTPPAFSSASVNGAALTVTFDGVLDTSSVTAASAFTVTVDGTDQTPAGVAFKSGDASMVVLTLAEALLATAGTVTLGYAAPDANPLRDPDNAKLPVPDFSGESVTNQTPADSTAPRFVSATANGTTMTLTFSEALDESVPQGGSLAPFIIRGSSSFNAKPLSYAIDGDTVTLTSHENNAVRHDHGQTVTVQYLRPGPAANQFKDLSGNVLASFPAQSVTNNTPPAFSSASVNGAALTVTFEGALDTGSVPGKDAFTVTVGGSEVGLAATGAVAVSGETVTLTLAQSVGGSLPAVTVAYDADQAGGKPLRDSDNANLPVTGFGDTKTVTNNTTDSTVPTLTSATVSAKVLTLIFSEPLDESSVPGRARFKANLFGVGFKSPASVAVDGNAVTLTLEDADAAVHDQTVGVLYQKPTGTPLRDLSGNEVVNFGISPPVSVANNTPPAFKSASVTGDRLTIVFEADLDTNSVPAPAAFTVSVDGTDQTPIAVAFRVRFVEAGPEPDQVVLTLRPGVAHRAQTVTVAYAEPATNPLRDADKAKLPVAGFSDKTVENVTSADTRAPEFSSASVDGTTLTLVFDEALDGSVPSDSAFTVTAGGGEMELADTNPVAPRREPGGGGHLDRQRGRSRLRRLARPQPLRDGIRPAQGRQISGPGCDGSVELFVRLLDGREPRRRGGIGPLGGPDDRPRDEGIAQPRPDDPGRCRRDGRVRRERDHGGRRVHRHRQYRDRRTPRRHGVAPHDCGGRRLRPAERPGRHHLGAVLRSRRGRGRRRVRTRRRGRSVRRKARYPVTLAGKRPRPVFPSRRPRSRSAAHAGSRSGRVRRRTVKGSMHAL